MQTACSYLFGGFVSFVALLIILCLLIPRARKYLLFTVKDSLGRLWEIVADYVPGKQKGFWAIPLFLLALILVSLLVVFFIASLLVAGPMSSIIKAIKYPEKVDDILQFDRVIHAPRPVKPEKTPEEIEAARIDYLEKLKKTQYKVAREEIQIDLDEHEIVFYTPVPVPEIEQAITDSLEDIRAVLERRCFSLFFLPQVCRQLVSGNDSERLEYYNPRTDKRIEQSDVFFTYLDIKEALCIPDIINFPCFIRCKRKDKNHLVFSFFEVSISGMTDIVELVKDYLNKLEVTLIFNHIIPNDYYKTNVDGLTADDCFDTDVYQIGKEIRERIEKLRAKGLTSLAIKKLIGDDSDKPGKLLIDSHYRLILTDYGNREIKLSPLHKAVFLLFLRHPEGIYFKDLSSYREELLSIYEEITGRGDPKAIEESINKLTDPYDNSINEKCARIKNAFVSEFREEVAQWYFIYGFKGERKSIRLPRELVIWEIKG